jgi:hypothetical protein
VRLKAGSPVSIGSASTDQGPCRPRSEMSRASQSRAMRIERLFTSGWAPSPRRCFAAKPMSAEEARLVRRVIDLAAIDDAVAYAFVEDGGPRDRSKPTVDVRLRSPRLDGRAR